MNQTVKPEVGGTYITADGEKVGPMEAPAPNMWAENVHVVFGRRAWYAGGNYHRGGSHRSDIVAVAQPSPVRTVTRQEIIPGTYDGVCVRPLPGRNVDVSLEGYVYNADALERAAAVLTALAGALRDGK